MKVKIKSAVPFSMILLSCFVVSAGAEGDWPRAISSRAGRTMVYQPQLDRLEGNVLYARAAVSVAPPGAEFPIFGAVWIEARIETDPKAQTVSLREIRVPRVHFAEETITQQKDFSTRLAGEISKLDVKLDRDQMNSMLDLAKEQNRDAAGFNDAPPKIVIASTPSFLVSFDGEPHFSAVEGTGLEAAINTPFLVVRHPQSNDHYLYIGGKTWYAAQTARGPWVATKNVPPEIRQLEPAEEEGDSVVSEFGAPPAIVIATESTELIVTDGPLRPKPLPGNKLLYAENSESHLLFEIDSQRYFILISGRWFASRSLSGPWKFVPSDGLPDSFAEIPSSSDEGVVLNWVSGTELAEKTVLDSYIPQTAAVRRDATITVIYDGPPQFIAIEKTGLYYAVNTGFQVIRHGDQYYCVEQGIWYVAGSAEGPWSVATWIPAEVLAIPPSSPVYNTKYVYIYDSTPEVVYFGYYPGYLHSYVYHGGMVYGTGWHYPSWRSRHRYYPQHCTWGYNMHWDPWGGWSTGIRYSSGIFSFAFWDSWRNQCSWWGPSGSRHSYHNHVSIRTTAHYDTLQPAVVDNIYQHKGNKARVVAASRYTTGDRFSGTAFDRNQRDRRKDAWIGSDKSKSPENRIDSSKKPGSSGRQTGIDRNPIVTKSEPVPDRGSHGSGGRNDGTPQSRPPNDKGRSSVQKTAPLPKPPEAPQRSDRINPPAEHRPSLPQKPDRPDHNADNRRNEQAGRSSPPPRQSTPVPPPTAPRPAPNLSPRSTGGSLPSQKSSRLDTSTKTPPHIQNKVPEKASK